MSKPVEHLSVVLTELVEVRAIDAGAAGRVVNIALELPDSGRVVHLAVRPGDAWALVGELACALDQLGDGRARQALAAHAHAFPPGDFLLPALREAAPAAAPPDPDHA